MSNYSYDYENRTGILPVSWEDFHGLCKVLAKGLYSQFKPELILAIGRGGYYPGILIAHILRIELYPVAISRRVNDMVKYRVPKWITGPPDIVKNKKILIIDEISSTGETLKIVKQKVKSLGAADVKSAVLYAHTTGVSIPDYIGIISDALIVNPWDREILINGEFRLHPEYRQALTYQGIEPGREFRINATFFELAKP